MELFSSVNVSTYYGPQGGLTKNSFVGITKSAGSSASHTHSLTGVKSGSASSLPPYYALAYIMRVA